MCGWAPARTERCGGEPELVSGLAKHGAILAEGSRAWQRVIFECPLFNGEIGGGDQAGAFIRPAGPIKQQFGSGFGEWNTPQFIDNSVLSFPLPVQPLHGPRFALLQHPELNEVRKRGVHRNDEPKRISDGCVGAGIDAQARLRDSQVSPRRG